MPRKLKSTHRRSEITVAGSGRFPIDMLRYDQCAPRNSGDASAIHGHDGEEFRLVTLNMYTDAPHGPERARWESFGWFVLTDEELLAYQQNPSIDAVKDLRAVVQGRETARGNFPRRDGT